MLFRDIDNQFFNKFRGTFNYSDFFIILMTLIPIGDISAIISSNAGLSHNGYAYVTDDIFYDGIGRAKLSRRSIDIETVVLGFVKCIGESFEIR